MKINKIETNYKNKMFLHKTDNIPFITSSNNIEKEVINIYPYLEAQEFIGFGRSFY